MTADEQAVMARVVAARRLELPADVLELAGSPGTMLGTERSLAPLAPMSPVGTAVLSTRPLFTWRAVPGATAYSVVVVDDRFAEVATSGRLSTTTWTPTTILPAAAALTWQVTAHLPERDVIGPAPPQPEARFRVVDPRTAATIDEQRARLSDHPLALGVLLAKAGLLTEAARELERAGVQPSDVDAARTLLADFEVRTGRR